MITILKRTLMIHARNRAGILFSLLSAFLVFLICVVFMQDSMINNVMQLSPSSSRDQVSWMISCWVMAGLLSITPVTTSCGVLVFMVMDREKKIIKDFKSSPLRKFDYPLGLVLAAVIFSFLITVLIGAVYMVYIGIRTGHWFSPDESGLRMSEWQPDLPLPDPVCLFQLQYSPRNHHRIPERHLYPAGFSAGRRAAFCPDLPLRRGCGIAQRYSLQKLRRRCF